jgi:long-chain acyl-CoA synthetase
MLYDRWRQISQAHADQIALMDLVRGRNWTFGELAAIVDKSNASAGPVIFAQTNCVEFILGVLLGWRDRCVLCPLEPGQPAPSLSGPLPEQIVHLKCTSASTGAPRLVAFTGTQLAADAQNIVTSMGLRPDWPNLGLISLAHSYGFSNLVLPLLLHGIPLTLVGAALPEALRNAAALHPSVTLAAVPALWRAWHDAQAIPSNVRLAISAGAPLPLSLEQAVFDTSGLKIHNFYGSSECGGIAYDRSILPRMDATSVGEPMANVSVSIADDGCVEVRGDAVGERYWPIPDPRLAGRVFRTSDLGEVRHGLIYLRGRATDQINIAGRKVAPEAIERVLAAHPQVRGCLAFGVPEADPQRGETIVACLSVEKDAEFESLRQFAIAHLPSWQLPRDWWFVDSVTANGRGKLSRAEWRKNYLEMKSERETG